MHEDDYALRTLSDLRDALREKGILDVKRSTLRNWYLLGAKTSAGTARLKTKKIGGRRMSSVAWVAEFMEEAGEF